MPFGISNAPGAFQGFINGVLFPYLIDFVVFYLNDILFYSPDFNSHCTHLCQVFSKLLENRLYVKPKKCEFIRNKVKFLGYDISVSGIAVTSIKVQDVVDWQTPTNRKKLRGFLGLANFSQLFIYEYSTISTPLTKLT